MAERRPTGGTMECSFISQLADFLFWGSREFWFYGRLAGPSSSMDSVQCTTRIYISARAPPKNPQERDYYTYSVDSLTDSICHWIDLVSNSTFSPFSTLPRSVRQFSTSHGIYKGKFNISGWILVVPWIKWVSFPIFVQFSAIIPSK